jgi:hypothetical protein
VPSSDYSSWSKWRCEIFHPRVLIDDFKITDWYIAENILLSYSTYLNNQINIRKEFFKLKRRQECLRYGLRYDKFNPNFNFISKSQVPSLVELAAWKFIAATEGYILIDTEKPNSDPKFEITESTDPPKTDPPITDPPTSGRRLQARLKLLARKPVKISVGGVRKPHRFRYQTLQVDPAAMAALPNEMLELIQEMSLSACDFANKAFCLCLIQNTTILDISYTQAPYWEEFAKNIEICKESLCVIKMAGYYGLCVTINL